MAFVGRDRELDRLQREISIALERALGRTVFIQGPPGAGKTTLATEFVARLEAARPGLRIARGRCLETFGTANPYLPFVEAIQDLSDRADAPTKQQAFSEMLTELAPYWLQVIPMVGGLLSATFATATRFRADKADTAAPSREALFVQYLELLQRLAREGPLVLFLDDLHWADHASVALLSHVARGVARLPVLIVGTLRSDDAELGKHPITTLIRELERESLATVIQLGELDSPALRQLVAAEFEGDVSEPLERWIEETAGGNPLFVSELCRLLRQTGGAVQLRGEWWLSADAAEFQVPRSAEAAIETRLEMLGAEEIKLLQYASVEGNEFSSVVLARLLDLDELDVLEVLEKLERTYKLVETTGEQDLPNGDIATTLRFRHALVQTVVYRGVTGKRRILLHRKAGEILEEVLAGETEPSAGRLARHFHLGRLSEPAYRYALAAADSARRVYAHWQAEEFYRIAIEHASADEDRGPLRERLGDVYDSLGHHAQALGAFQESLASAAPGSPTELRLRRKILSNERKLGGVPVPVLLERLKTLAEEARGLPQERARILLQSAYLPGLEDVLGTLREAVAIAESAGQDALLAEALEQLAVALIFNSDPQLAFEPLERAFTIGDAASDPFRAARHYNIRGVAHGKLGQYRQALASFERMLANTERMGYTHGIGAACTNMGCELLKLGEYARAEQVLQRARVIHERRDRATLVHSTLNLAKRAHWAGDIPLAFERYTGLLSYAREFGYWTSEAVAHAGLGLCRLETGELEPARAAAIGAVEAIRGREEWFEDREAAEILLAHLEAIAGSPETGAARLSRAAAILCRMDLFAWTQVELERVRIMCAFDASAAREALQEVIAATRGVEFALDGEVDALREALGMGRELVPLVAS